MSTKILKILGMVASIGAIVCTLVSDFVDDKMLDQKVIEAVHNALTENKND